MSDFGDYLRQKMHIWVSREVGKVQGIPSQADFAVMLGVPTSNLSTWMLGQKKISDEYLDLIAEKLTKHKLAANATEVYAAAGRSPGCREIRN